MMVLSRAKHSIEHKHFYDIIDYIDSNSILVLNNTKVLPARLYGKKEETGAKIEVLLLKSVSADGHIWEVLIKPSKRVKVGTVVKVSDELAINILEKKEDDGEWVVELLCDGNVLDVLHRNGNIPLPPYIERKMAGEDLKKLDFERYQTVYAKDEGSVAAPTAGLHFTQEILEKLKQKGVEIVYVTLNVGMGTFRPVKCENILEHKMHSEAFEITEEAAAQINRAKEAGKKVIYPPYKFGVVDELITNFHLPKSTLLMLVSAFAGKDFIFEAYKEAVENKYRFFSYGDCMFIK